MQVNTAISIKVVLQKPSTVNYDRARDDRLMLSFTFKLGIIFLKQHGGHIGNLLRQMYLLKSYLLPEYQGLNTQESITSLRAHSSQFTLLERQP